MKQIFVYLPDQRVLRAKVSYSTAEPTVLVFHLPSEDEIIKWAISRELLANVVLDDLPYSGEIGGDVIISYGDNQFTNILITSDSMSFMEYFEMKVRTSTLTSVLELSYLRCARGDEYELAADHIMIGVDELLRTHA